MKPLLRRALELVLASGVAVLVFAPGCGKQNEGERCDFGRGGPNADCESGLVCTSKDQLINGDTDRCCPRSGNPTDDRCLPNTGLGGSGGKEAGVGGSGGTGAIDGAAGAAGGGGVSGGGGTAGAGGSDGGGGDAGASGSGGTGGTGGGDSGVECLYSSQCPGTQICGPTGHCQPECLGPKDCPSGQTCISNVCLPITVDSGAD